MAKRILWTRDQLLVALNIYEKIPFGLFDEDQPVIRDIAKRLKRTPASLAMKLGNLASLDPATHARGRKGLPGASNLDREIWGEFQENRETLAPVSEELFRALFGARDVDELDLVNGSESPQRAAVFSADGAQRFRQPLRCHRNSIRELLVASHILPWRSHPSERLNAQNGVCLSRLHDGAFDRGLVTFDEKSRLILSKELRAQMKNATLQRSFADFEGAPLVVPNKALPPKPEFFAFHREHIFRG